MQTRLPKQSRNQEAYDVQGTQLVAKTVQHETLVVKHKRAMDTHTDSLSTVLPPSLWPIPSVLAEQSAMQHKAAFTAALHLTAYWRSRGMR